MDAKSDRHGALAPHTEHGQIATFILRTGRWSEWENRNDYAYVVHDFIGRYASILKSAIYMTPEQLQDANSLIDREWQLEGLAEPLGSVG